MIKRIAMWKLRPDVDVEELAAAIRSLEENVDSIIDVDVSININPTNSAYDFFFRHANSALARLGSFGITFYIQSYSQLEKSALF